MSQTWTRWVEILPDALEANIRQLRTLIGPSVKLAAVVKGNGYGHGLLTVTDTLARTDADFLAVSELDDAITLAQQSYNKQLLLLTPLQADQADQVSPGLHVTVTGREAIRALARTASRHGHRQPVHIKIDTGMTRFGQAPSHLLQLAEEVRAHRSLRLAGVWTHLADGDDPERSAAQLARLEQAAPLAEWRSQGVLLHAAATGPVVTGLSNFWCDLVRPGLAVYGLGVNGTPGFRSALHWHARLLEVKSVPAGTPVGYGGTHITATPARIGVVNVGFIHGYPRHLSGKAFVLIGGRKVPVVGRIAMEFMMVDLTDVPTAAPGDQVTLIGEQMGAAITVDELVQGTAVIPNELICNLPLHIERHIKRTSEVESL